MKVIRASVAGFCMGVRRAVTAAEAELAAAVSAGSSRRGVYSLGPLIHNPGTLERLGKAGLEILDEENPQGDLSGAAVIIRAHGVSPSVEDSLVRRGARLRDATCPRVKAGQMKARSLAAGGRVLFLAGQARHAEIAGIRGYAPSCLVVGNVPEAEAAAGKLYRDRPSARTALMGQTTMTPEEYKVIGEEIRKFFPGLEIIDTICGAVRERQDALRSLASQVDAVVVAGGGDSANTRGLLAAALSLGKPAWLVEKAADLPPEIFTYERVGLAAGASTPEGALDEIERALLYPPQGSAAGRSAGDRVRHAGHAG
ncbi:MAG: 4-hydroxy-3-methylbut-2-enyl diphosphate reductase [Treponema sp.]|jgi:4-hydroxy-3-methylbut-2-enyl diphosphate reductase|nr:4-hydroxy-3-methylbut-2-enyl diphosphate reductase [Treponema sp.]